MTGSTSPKFAAGTSDSATAITAARTRFITGPATDTRTSFHAGICARAPDPRSPSSAFVPSGSTSGIRT